MKLSEKITIVVPCKNEENYIHHLLDSLRGQLVTPELLLLIVPMTQPGKL